MLRCFPSLFTMPRFLKIKKDVEQILKDTDSFYKIYHDLRLPEEVIKNYIEELAEIFKCSDETIRLSSDVLLSSPFTLDMLYPFLWRLCANRSLLKEDKPVVVYDRFTFSGTEEVKFLSARNVGEKYRVHLRVLTGHYAWGLLKADFSLRAVNRILMCCGFHGKKYPPGRAEICLPGLYVKARLKDSEETPSVLDNIESSGDIEAFNRKYVISPRLGYVSCPLNKIGPMRCLRCNVCQDKCFASYKEKANE